MSLLLDALRKSEDQRRKGELPSLDQPLSASPVIATGRRGPSMRSVLFVLLIFILLIFVIWWWLNQPAIDEPVDAPALASQLEPETGAETLPEPVLPVVERGTGSTQTMNERVAELVPVPDEDAADQAIEVAQTNPAVIDEASSENSSSLVAAAEAETAASETDQSINPAAEMVSTSDQPSRSVQPESIEPEAIAPNPLESLVGQQAEVAVEPVQEPLRSFIYAWELPLEARQDFPDLNVAVHVFASDPASRFVLINGERYGEGDSLAPGVVLDEITREGALVGFRNYRILLQ